MRIKSFARRALATALILVMVPETFAVVFADDADPSAPKSFAEQGYEWHRIHSEEELEAFKKPGATDKDPSIPLFGNYGSGTWGAVNGVETQANKDQWFRALIVYSTFQEELRSQKLSDGSFATRTSGYFISGINTCNDGESYAGKKAIATYGIDLDANEFVTLTGLNTPFIKFVGRDDDNRATNGTDCPQFAIRFSDGGQGLGNQLYTLNISWYGVRWHAAAYCQVRFPDVKDPEDSDTRGWACHSNGLYKTNFQFGSYAPEVFDKKNIQIEEKKLNALIAAYERYRYLSMAFAYANPRPSAENLKERVMKWAEQNLTDKKKYDLEGLSDLWGKYDAELRDYLKQSYDGASSGTCYIYYNVKGVFDRHWEFNDWDYEIGYSKYQGGTDQEFMLWLGLPHQVPKVIVNTEIVIGETRTYDGNYIEQGITVRVPVGATLVIRGTVMNNGRIIVDGGTMIVTGQLDSTPGISAKNDIQPGTLDIINGGMVVVEEPGAIIQRGLFNTITVEGGSSLNVEGALVCPGRLKVNGSTFRSYPGSFVGVGLIPDKEVAAKSFGREYLYNNDDKFLSQFGTNNMWVNMDPSKNKGLGFDGTSLLITNSSFYAFGGFYNPASYCCSGKYYTFIGRSVSNINASLGSSMYRW